MISRKNIVLAALISLTLIFLVDRFGKSTVVHPAEQEMNYAVLLSEQWMGSIDSVVSVRGLSTEKDLSTPHNGVIGIDYSPITTTLGVLESKELSTNPNFAALIVRYLVDAGIDSTKTVAVTMSGSFPGLAISTIAALQTLKTKAMIVSSIGASSYGANRPELTWLDMENILQQDGMKYHSSLVTPGAEGDSGAGLFDNGKGFLIDAAERNNVRMFIPETFQEAINKRLQLFQQAKISLLINIGGSHAILGNCPHGESIPNGFHETLFSCFEKERGVIVRVSEQGIPVIHLLNIRSLGEKFGVHSSSVRQAGTIFENIQYNKIIVLCAIVMIFVIVILFKTKK